MRILEIINQLNRGGGAEKFVLDLSIALSTNSGAEVDVVSIAPPLNNDFTNQLNAYGITHRSIGKRLKDISNIFTTAKAIRLGNYDAVHVHLFPALYIVGLAKMFGLLNNTKIYYTEHSTTNRRRNNKLLQLFDKIIYRQYGGIIAISNKVKANLSKHLNFSDISIINNGINLNIIKSTEPANLHSELGIPGDACVVTMVGRFIIGKDYDTLLSTLEKLPEKFHIVCVGDGPTRQSVENTFITKKYAKNIHFLGLRSDVIAILKASDITVLSTEHEGFSISMLESMACGKPFVASAVPGVKDLVGGIAELFEYKNVDQLSNILLQLSSDNDHYQAVAERCHNFASRFDINQIASIYLTEFQK